MKPIDQKIHSALSSKKALESTFGWFLLLFLIFLPYESLAQDPIYSQYYNQPESINPAFSGRTHSPLIAAGMRLQWPGVQNAYRTATLSYSQFFNEINSGAGLLVMADNAGDGILTNIRLSGYYSYRIQIDRNTFIQSGIEITGVQSKLDWDQLVFADQIDPVSGVINPGGMTIPSREQRPENLTNNYFNLGFGLLYSAKNYYLGVGLRHLNRPNVGFLDDAGAHTPRQPLLYTFMAGTQIELNPGRSIYLMPNVLFARQSELMQINAGSALRFDAISVGLYYRHNSQYPDAVQAHLGYRYDMYTIGYAFDFTVSRLASHSSGAHEISLLINLDNKAGRPKVNYSDCLDIFRY